MEPNQQPDRLNQWSATFHERRTAMFIAAVCIVIIGAAIVAPQWFASTTDKPQQAEAEQPTRSAQPSYRISSPPPVASVSTQTPVERARPEPAPKPAPKPASKPVASKPVAAVAPKPKPVAAPSTPRPPTVGKAPSGYFVQVGAFKDRKLADNLLKKLTDHGFNSRLVDRGNGLLGVWIGPEESRQGAGKLLEELQNRLKLKGFITHSG